MRRTRTVSRRWSPLPVVLLFAVLPGPPARSAEKDGAAPPASETTPSAPSPPAVFKHREASIGILQPPLRKQSGTYTLKAVAMENPAGETAGRLSFPGPADDQTVRSRQNLTDSLKQSLREDLPEKERPPASAPRQPTAAELEQGRTALLISVLAAKGAVLPKAELPAGYTVQFSLQGVPDSVPHRPAASLGCALLIAAMTGDDYQPGGSVLVAGHIREDGNVGHVPFLPAMLNEAKKTKFEWVVIPQESLPVLYACALDNGPQSIVGLPVFDVFDLTEAKRLTQAQLPGAERRSLQLFDDIRRALPAQKQPLAWLKHPKVIAKLEEVLKASPNNSIARVFLTLAGGRGQLQPSVGASMEIIHDIVQQARATRFEKNKSMGAVKALTAKFTVLQNVLHSRTAAYTEKSRAFCEGMAGLAIIDNPKRQEWELAHARQRTAMHVALAPLLTDVTLLDCLAEALLPP